ncbi:MAG: ACT domain-containing protein [Kiritimatiellae bacterium]|nr:ACT domain-containing protein [Kiritimatiellia bacterium]
MNIKQISVFLENRPGRLSAPCEALAAAGVNIRTLSLADTERFGILRLIVQDWERARDALERAGLVVHLTDVLAIEAADQPGGLLEILKAVEHSGANIEYMYAFALRRGDRAVFVLRFSDPAKGIAALQEAGVNVLQSAEFFAD